MKKTVITFALYVIAFNSFSMSLMDLDGTWGTDCDYNDGLIQLYDNEIILELYSNQVYIKLEEKIIGESIHLYFSKVSSSGRGGEHIDWNDISRDSSVAIANNLDSSSFDLEIIGLRSKSNGKVLYTPMRAEKHNKMVECVFKL